MSETHPNPPGPMSSVAERLEWARSMRGYKSPREAASALGLVPETYRSHEMGRRGAHGLKDHHVRRYARAFKVNAFWLQTGEGSPTAIDVKEITPEELRLIEAYRATKGAA